MRYCLNRLFMQSIAKYAIIKRLENNKVILRWKVRIWILTEKTKWEQSL